MAQYGFMLFVEIDRDYSHIFSYISLNGMDGLYVEKLMGHDIELMAHYFKPSSQELLEGNDHKLGFISVIDALTINVFQRYCIQNDDT